MCPLTRCRALKPLLLLGFGAAAHAKNWYDGLPNVKVLHPENDNQHLVDEIFRIQNNSHFGVHRYALLLLPGEYKPDFGIKVSYYTSVIGVGKTPDEVKLNWVMSPNGKNTHATNNFWRSVEGVTLWGKKITWAVSQASPLRRSIIKNGLELSHDNRYSSGGFMSDVSIQGYLSMGTQQQWFFRNVDVLGKMYCPSGWNYVFVGQRGLSWQAQQACAGATPGKVMSMKLPWVAEKPFLVMDDGTWQIHVPKFVSSVVGASSSIIGWKLNLEEEVFITRPGMTAQEINDGMRGKKGLLVTPGIYELNDPILVKDSHFVVLGIGWPTLVAADGRPAVQVADGVLEVRVAGLLLEAGTPLARGSSEPLLLWGTKAKKEYVMPGTSAGLVADVFARVGTFKYRGCKLVRTDTMMEINSDDVVLDHVWLWHADHDDCGTDLNHTGTSDQCHSTHGLVVNGRRVTSYGLAAEHTVGGSMTVWNGEEGNVYFYQSEVPYHQADWALNGYAGYVVGKHVERHTARGVGVYIISSKIKGKIRAAFLLPPWAEVYNLFNVTIGKLDQFGSLACSEDGSCYRPQRCTPMRCYLPSFPRKQLPLSRVQAFHRIQAKAKSKLLKRSASNKTEEIIRDEVPVEQTAVLEAGPACRGAAGFRSAACARFLSLWTIPGLSVLAAAVLGVQSLAHARRRAAERRTLLAGQESDDSEEAGQALCGL